MGKKPIGKCCLLNKSQVYEMYVLSNPLPSPRAFYRNWDITSHFISNNININNNNNNNNNMELYVTVEYLEIL